MPIRNDDYIPRTEAAIFDTLVIELLNEEDDANPRAPSTITNATLRAIARTIAQNQEQSLQNVYRAAYVEDATGEDLTKKARNLGVIRKDAQKATGVVTFSRDSPPTQDTTIPAGTIVETVEIDPIKFETMEKVTMTTNETNVQATIQAVEGGAHGNVGPHAIQAIPSPPIELSVDNDDPTGDPTLIDTNGDPFVEGRNEETDSDLRARVLDTDATNEAPSADGIELALNDGIKDVINVYSTVNPTDSVVNGIDPYSSEIVVYGGDSYEIARTLYETMSMTSVLRLQGGINGNYDEGTVYSQFLDQNITISFTRPIPLSFDLTLDVVHTDIYEGDVAVKDAIVEYVGGTRADDSTVTGIGIGENVLINEIENIAEDIQGVEYADVTLIDKDSDGTDDSTTDSDGVPVLSVANSEVSRLDADNITLNTTAR